MNSRFIAKTHLRFSDWLRLILTVLPMSLCLIACDEAPTEPAVDANAHIVILAPTGGEHFKVGQILHVQWRTQGKGEEEVTAANIFLSPDSGKTWIGLLKGSIGREDPLWGDYPWSVPAVLQNLGVSWNFTANDRVMLKVMQYATGDANKIAVTPKTFSITAK